MAPFFYQPYSRQLLWAYLGIVRVCRDLTAMATLNNVCMRVSIHCRDDRQREITHVM